VKAGVVAALGIALAWAALALAQLWLGVLDADIFFKITITAGVLVVAIVIVLLVVREHLSSQDLKARGFIDGD
jgi:hypothetical protein